MESHLDRSILVVPYTMLEKEALDWALLFFNSLVFSHPFPLPLPDPYQPLMAVQRIRVWTAERTPQEIQRKDRWLREYRQFAAQNPDASFLATLKQVKTNTPPETRDEIVALLKGGPDRPDESPPPAPAIEGDLLLCLIHEHLQSEWEVDQSLALVEEAEKNLMRIVDQGWEDQETWETGKTAFRGFADPEIVCPPALEAWRQMKNPLALETRFLLTTQSWVWRDYYKLDPEDPSLSPVRLPDLRVGSPPGQAFNKTDKGALLHQYFWDALVLRPPTSRSEKIANLAGALSDPELPPEGRYVLVFPPDLEEEGSKTRPMVLLTRR